MFWTTSRTRTPEPTSASTFRVLGCRPAATSYSTAGVTPEQASILHFWDAKKLSLYGPIAKTDVKVSSRERTSAKDRTRRKHSRRRVIMYSEPPFTLSQVSANLKHVFLQHKDDQGWLEDSIPSLSFLALNNQFPSLTLAQFANLELVIAMRGKDQYALLLVHEYDILVEGRPRKREMLDKGFFDAVAIKVEWVIRYKEKHGEKWVGA